MDRRKILVVDDSKTAQMVCKMILKNNPYDVVFADDGAEGVEKARSESPDLILMDIVMPGMNGLDALKKIRSLPETRHIPVIMITTRGEEDNLEMGYKHGCNDYVMKPIKSSELIEKIQDLIG